ncbi:MAG: hypothetical protein JWO52_4014 [Gammaproteobacteria bacterium]|nr:hypothetical protein [Gammaproteobacteria bacterium]
MPKAQDGSLPMSARHAVELYDAELVRVDATQQTVTFRHRDCGLILRTRCPTLWKSGAVGRLTVFPSGEFGFYVYPDPRLRRLEAFDDEDGRQWGWRLGEYRLWAKAGVIPGVNGSVVKEDVVSLQMPVPREFSICAPPISSLRPAPCVRSSPTSAHCRACARALGKTDTVPRGATSDHTRRRIGSARSRGARWGPNLSRDESAACTGSPTALEQPTSFAADQPECVEFLTQARLERVCLPTRSSLARRSCRQGSRFARPASRLRP